MSFSFRVKSGDYEVEISGTKNEVLGALDDLPILMTKVLKGVEEAKLKAIASSPPKPLTVRVTSSPSASTNAAAQSMPIPSIPPAKQFSQSILSLLETDWGRWRPRTMPEIIEALKANAIHYPATTLSGVLTWLVKKGKVRRWKTDEGYVYILAETGE
ncbi:MAG TPA: hypothetical protein VK487_08000 [Candidatus Bathyarchaeia archaeon]|nr:hypothetical protein [Candidatus Bathyarchaeia archaeon]